MPLLLASPFTDNMVLQRGMPISVWGTAQPGARITADFRDHRATAVTDQTGSWNLQLPALNASAQPAELVITASLSGGLSERCSCKNVLVGEVWICSGQSNMEWPLSLSNDADQEIAQATHPSIRLLTVPKKTSDTPLNSFAPTTWVQCSPTTVSAFSAVGYYFGRELQRRLDVPIGLINSCWGGTPAETWTSSDAVLAHPALSSMVSKVKAPPVAPPPGTWYFPNVPGELYNGMIAPLIPYAIRGVIWYQGESNADRPEQYRILFPTLISDWRKRWNRDDMPFHFVQLANYITAKDQPAQQSQWALVREAQLMTLSLPHTGMAVAIDIGDANDIHPRNKHDVGLRLAFNALHQTYGQKDVVPCGPLLRHAKPEGPAFHLWFDHADGGLVSRGHKLTGFTLAGSDGTFHDADAKIDGDTVVVTSPAVPDPKAVRYAWADNPECNLYNGAGLPASPVRSDRD